MPRSRKFLVDRYGDFILYNPPVKPTTWLLWFGPLALLLLAIGVLLNVVRRNQQQSDSPVLDAQQRARAQALLHETDSKK
jgi:cytochrome c-type biogenesis protein CcmH